MANLKLRGRKKGSVNNLIVSDPIMEPFFITKDQYSYVVNERQKLTGNGVQLKPKPQGYYNNFDMALKFIAESKIGHNKKQFDSLSEFINEWRTINNQISNTLKKSV